jgi:site-specific recombinase XerD
VDIEQVTTSHLRTFFLEQSNKYAAGTAKLTYVIVTGFFGWCEDEEYLAEGKNPARKTKPPKVPKQIQEPASLDDIKKLIATCNKEKFVDVRDECMIRMLLATGCRAHELLAIELKNLDTQTGKIKLTKTKGDKSRFVWVSNGALDSLKRYLDFHPIKNRRYLFTVSNSDGSKPLHYESLKVMLKQRSLEAGVQPYIPAHAFRRSFAVNFLRNGGNLRTLMECGGWSGMEILQRYLKLSSEDVEHSFGNFAPSI